MSNLITHTDALIAAFITGAMLIQGMQAYRGRA